MKADLLDSVGDVGMGECQVLEGPGVALELSQISNKGPLSGGDLGLRVHRRRDRLQSTMPACSRLSRAIWHQVRKSPSA
jgi:hypothetical protein